MSKRPIKTSNRDTAKDIMLGLAPSGQGPRAPKEGVASYQPPKRSHSSDNRVNGPSYSNPYTVSGGGQRIVRNNATAPRLIQPPTTIIDRRPDNTAIDRLQNQISQLQKQNQDLLAQEQAARRRLEANQEALHRKVATAGSGVTTREFDDLRRQMSTVEGRLMTMSSDLNGLKGALDRQVSDLMSVNNEMKARPVVDPSKISNVTSQLDVKVRDLHNQIMQLKQQVEREQSDRANSERKMQDTIARLQDIIRQQDQQRNDLMTSLSKKGDVSKEKLNEESRRLNDKISVITTEVTKSTTESQQKLRDEMNHKYNALDSAFRGALDGRNDFESEMKKRIDGNMRIQADQIDVVAKSVQAEKTKYKERFQQVNEALAALEHHLELGNKKMDKIVNAEIQGRKLHEKGLLSKLQDIEDRLNVYTNGMQTSLDKMENGEKNVKMPVLDFDALRREMEAIAADKNKLSMEGLLKLEEKMSKVQQSLTKDRRDINDKVAHFSEGQSGESDQLKKLKDHLAKLDAFNEDMEETQERIRDKVERQIPQDLNELSAKADNIKHQLNTRIDKEEEERYLAIKELQEAFSKLSSRMGTTPSPNGDKTASVKRDMDECKIAIKKLAESVTTVKNVLDKKIVDEVRTRENDVDKLNTKIKNLSK